MTLTFSQDSKARVDRILSRYPDRMAACLPVLHVAQEEFEVLSPEVMELVASTLELPASHVFGTATFYTMLNVKKVGTFHVQVCTNVSCMLCSAHDVLGRLEQRLGIRAGQTTADGMFTLSEVECLAFCGSGPAVQVNDEIHELVSPDRVDGLLDELRSKGK